VCQSLGATESNVEMLYVETRGTYINHKALQWLEFKPIIRP